MKKYRSIAIVLAVLTVFSLSACGFLRDGEREPSQNRGDVSLWGNTPKPDFGNNTEEDPLNPDPKPAEPDDKPTEPDTKPAEPDDKPAEPDSKPPVQEKVLVASGLQSNAIAKSTGASFMDMLYYCKSSLSFGESNENSDATGSRKYDGKEEDKKAIDAYVSLLCTEYDFEVIGTPYIEEYNTNLYGRGVYFDYVLKYTGSERLYGGSVKGNFSKVSGDLAIWGKIDKRGSMEGYINYNSTLKPCDDGFRYGTGSETKTLLGDSVTAGLYRLPDGSFQTSDSRLQAELGKAQVLTGGKRQTASVQYEIDKDRGRLYVKVLNQYDTAVLGFYIPTSEDWEEGIYPADKFIREESYIVKEGGIHDRYPSYTWPTMFTALKGDDYILPIRGMSGEMTGLNVRLMYLQPGKTAVFYSYCTFRTSPFTVEALIAVDLSSPHEASTSGSGSNTSSGSSGVTPARIDCPSCTNGKCPDCNGTGMTKKYTSGMWLNQTCDTCSGDRKCDNCRGKGYLG